jgi:hypothetical protein
MHMLCTKPYTCTYSGSKRHARKWVGEFVDVERHHRPVSYVRARDQLDARPAYTIRRGMNPMEGYNFCYDNKPILGYNFCYPRVPYESNGRLYIWDIKTKT